MIRPKHPAQPAGHFLKREEKPFTSEPVWGKMQKSEHVVRVRGIQIVKICENVLFLFFSGEVLKIGSADQFKNI